MGRIDAARETMRKLDWDDRALEASFPEFAAVKDNFTFGEVWQGGVLDTRQRLLVSAACLATVEGGDLEPVLDAALGQGVSPAELQEVFHQAAPYVGFARAERGLGVLEKLLKAHGVDLPLAPQATVTEEDRLEEGIAVQRSIFGPMIDAMRANAAPDQMFMQDALSAHCFGDTYTRASRRASCSPSCASSAWAAARVRPTRTRRATSPWATTLPCWLPPSRSACPTSAFPAPSTP